MPATAPEQCDSCSQAPAWRRCSRTATRSTRVKAPTLGGDGSCCAGRCTTEGGPRCCLTLPRGSPSEPVRLGTAALCCCCCGCGCCRGAFWLHNSSSHAPLAAWAGASTCRATGASYAKNHIVVVVVPGGHHSAALADLTCVVRLCRCGGAVGWMGQHALWHWLGAADCLEIRQPAKERVTCLVTPCRCGAAVGRRGQHALWRWLGAADRLEIRQPAKERVTPWLPWSPLGSPEAVALLAGRLHRQRLILH